MVKKNILFVLLVTYLTIPFCLADTTRGMTARKWSQKLKEFQKEEQALTQKKLPHLKGLLVSERTELLLTNRQIQLLIIELKKSLAESKLALADTQQHLAQLIQAFTYLAYTMSVVICIFVIASIVKK